MQETQNWFLGGEDPLEKEMATHSRSLAWKIPQTEESIRLQSMGSQRVRHNLATKQQQRMYSLMKSKLPTAPRRNRGSGSSEPLATEFSSTDQFITLFSVFLFKDQSIHNLVFCVLLFKVIFLICSVDSLTLNSRPTALWLTPEWSLSNTCGFSIRYITAF